MKSQTASFVSDLAASFPMLKATYAEHSKENFGEVLPHLAMADFCRVVCKERKEASWVGDFFDFLEDHFSENFDDDISNLIAVSFVENLPVPSEGHWITSKLSPKLKRHYRLVFGP